jgi:hypothetical protein
MGTTKKDGEAASVLVMGAAETEKTISASADRRFFNAIDQKTSRGLIVASVKTFFTCRK